ncbi:MAG: hypothetical protein MJA29_08895, partial [Candidatus Omnitrophica bacterium]|nr:hypothetical protein [Candidatus Omnitrophota bacterium]
WQGKAYFYTRLVFGCRSSPKIFDQLSQAICWIAQNNYQIEFILHLLDDFITLDTPSCIPERNMALLKLIFRRLNIPTAPHKTIGPAQLLEFLGILLDTVNMLAKLPQDKIQRISQLIQDTLSRRTITKRDLLVILGHFNFASRVIVPGRSFVSYLIKLSTTVSKLHHHVTLNAECRKDLQAWSDFLQSWNGVAIFLDTHLTQAPDLELYTDSSSTIGFGGYFQKRYFYGRWPEGCTLGLNPDLSMAYLELFPIVVAALLWGDEWRGKKIMFHCDNMATVHILKKGRSKSIKIMKLMRILTMKAANCSFAVFSKHCPGISNSIADSLSRFEFQRFRQLAPDAEPHPWSIPPEVLQILTE